MVFVLAAAGRRQNLFVYKKETFLLCGFPRGVQI